MTLSITGVEGPTSNGDAAGSCGQIYKPLSEYKSPELCDGWTVDKYNKLIDIWKRWHLNDMRAGCEHQRALGWEEIGGRDVTLYHFTLQGDITSKQRAIEDASMEKIKKGEQVKLTEEEQKIAVLEYTTKSPTAQLPELIAEYYEEDGTETKKLTWLTEQEHPEGILSKPCPTCGYKYGNAWNFEQIPVDVYNFLRNLPPTPEKPAWVF